MGTDENTDESPPESDQPAPENRWQLGKNRMEVTSGLVEPEPPKVEEEPEEIPDRGWKRAVYDLRGELVWGEWPALPEVLEKVAPVMNVLHTAGERALLKLEDGREYIVYGWPDLRRPNSRAVAIRDGQPLGEIVALHRYPVMTGVSVSGRGGMLLPRTYDVETACKQVTGRSPDFVDGYLFAAQGDSVWFERDGAVFKWDGRKETNDGSPKQVLASLLLHWSNR
jgi:hypothetical protein